MSIQPGSKRWLTIGAVLLLAVAGTTIAGIQGTGIRALSVFGTVEHGRDGLRVNGIPYDTSHASVLVDGLPGNVSELRSGHIVSAHGSVSANGSTAIADEIVLENDVRGVVTSVDAARSVFTVLGQTIRVTDGSILDPLIQPNDLSGLTNGTWVKVSAYERSDGSFEASRVDLDLAPGQSQQVRGVVRALDSEHQTLRIGDLTVDYSAAQTRGVVAEGAIVVARGLQTQSGGALFASKLDVFSGVGHAGEQGNVRGIITQFASAADFEVNGQPVLTTRTTAYVLHGQSLGPDVEVHVIGRFDASGVLVARKVQMNAPNAGQARAAQKRGK